MCLSVIVSLCVINSDYLFRLRLFSVLKCLLMLKGSCGRTRVITTTTRDCHISALSPTLGQPTAESVRFVSRQWDFCGVCAQPGRLRLAQRQSNRSRLADNYSHYLQSQLLEISAKLDPVLIVHPKYRRKKFSLFFAFFSWSMRAVPECCRVT